MLAMTAAELLTFLGGAFPGGDMSVFSIDRLDDHELWLRFTTGHEHTRPGGTVSGPTLMTLADTAAYLVLLSQIGAVALAVTTNLSIHFLRKPEVGFLVARTSLLKRGKRLAIAEVAIHANGGEEPVAHATVTYSIP